MRSYVYEFVLIREIRVKVFVRWCLGGLKIGLDFFASLFLRASAFKKIRV